MSWNALTAALLQKCGFEATDVTPGPNQVRILGRVPTARLQDWLFVLDNLDANSGNLWTCDLSKKYFRRNKRLVYAWRLIFQGEEVLQHLHDIIRVVNTSARSARQEITEFPLIGASPNRDMPPEPGRRGASRTLAGPKL